MPFDLRRCAEAAARAALAEAFAPPEAEPRRRRRPRRRPVRTLLLGAGLATTARLALDPAKRRELLDGLARRFPIQELLDEMVLEADVVPEADHLEGPKTADQEPDEKRQPGENDAKPAKRTAATKKPATPAKKPAAPAKRRTTPAKKPATGAKKQTAGASKPAATEHRRRHISRQRGDADGQSRRKPPNRGTRA